MPFQHSPAERQTRSQSRAQAVLTPTPRGPLIGTPVVPQLRAHSQRGPVMTGTSGRKEGRGPRRSSSFSGVVGTFPGISRTTLNGPGEDDAEEDKNSVEEEESYITEASPTPVGAYQGSGGKTLSQSNQSEPSLLNIMQRISQIIPILNIFYVMKLQDSIFEGTILL
ncbi:hypothetical protein O181_032108 [Austropuccinia psidii MF-1]|uniref:Uncharacterized protein n=1 Tax=Austropuccinia psidii MF-1 TaxID=1389203 RepID=A0A9Q3CYU0_9BASI|nr:hypothetical protein [Austropuccinia psidii MF-1]